MMSSCVSASHRLMKANSMNTHPPVNAITFSLITLDSISPPMTAMRLASMCAAMAPTMTLPGLCCVASAMVANMDLSPHSATNIMVNVCHTAPHGVFTSPSSFSSASFSASSASARSPCVVLLSPPSSARISDAVRSSLCSFHASKSSCVPKMPNRMVASTSITSTLDFNRSALDATKNPTMALPNVMKNSAVIVPKNTGSFPCRIASSIAKKNVLSPSSVINTMTKEEGTPAASQWLSSGLSVTASTAGCTYLP
mmetsp:Transcript_31287/g.77815  ORF Transcript_31287/g.77815 Transcript_31287/m.77815 type:complete len:255 (+) Transcript_31287:278-1042(+)